MSDQMTGGARHDALVRLSESDKVVSLDRSRPPEINSNPVSRPLIRIHLLGSMRATTYLGDNILPRGRKARAILACLCLASGERIPRARLATLLWDRVPDDQARKSFRQSLRELMGAMDPLATELISANRETIRLDTNLCWIDALALLAPQPNSLTSLRSDLAGLCSGELLEDLEGASPSFDLWLLGERTRFTEELRALLEAELVQLTQSGHDPVKQASAARRLIAFDPTHEGASRALMRALNQMGERAQSVREYHRCRTALKKTLDVDPSAETQALYKASKTFLGRVDQAKNNAASPLPAITPAAPRSDNQSPSAAHHRLRVGVLPFLVTGSSREQGLAVSLGQEIAAALARFRWFDVIAPISLMRGPSVTMATEALLQRRKLDYVVDGTLTGTGRSFKISVRLLDVTDGARPVWSDRFELAVGELHKVDELVTARIVGRIDPVILFIEGQPKRRERYGATGLLLLAIPLFYSMERRKYEEAGRLINQALEIEPDNAMVAAWAAFWQVFHVGQGWTHDATRAMALAQDYAVKAIKLDPDNAEALGIFAHVCAFLNKDFDSALHYFDRALRLNPNLAFIWALSAPTHCYVGEPEAALERLQRYRDLAPFDPYCSWFEYFYTMAYTFKGDFEQAVTVGRRAVKVSPDFVNGYKPLIASLGQLGRRGEAKTYIEKLLTIEPNFTVERFGQVYPFKHAADRERYMLGLRLAGVPER
jgi:DNA-binding SARP family transcriptional activator/TolB-like protein/cytochrome c-type biogenesis protein CcmH/NrfG